MAAVTVLDELAPRIDTASKAELLELFGELATATKYTEMKMLDHAIQQAANGGNPDPRPDYTTAEVAAMFPRHRQTVRDWIHKGLLDAYRFRGHREYRITPESLQRFIREQREPLKLEAVGPEPDLNAWQKVSGE